MVCFFFGLGLALSPLYLGQSGGVQPAHLLLLVALMFGVRRLLPLARIDVLLAAYVMYACIREGVAVVQGAELSTLLPVAQLGFGFLTYLLARKYFADVQSLSRLPKWCIVAVLVAVAGVLVLGSGRLEAQSAERAIGTFNNPNQLGYFGVLLASISILLFQRGVLEQKYAFVLILMCIYLCVVSLSKSAMAGAVLVLLAYLAQSFSKRTVQFLCYAVIFLVSMFVALEMNWLRVPALEDLAAYQRVVGAVKENDTSFAVRGYGILDDASWGGVIFGLSSSGVAGLRGGYEVHSTYMAPIGAYGVLGGGLFLLFLGNLMVMTMRRLGILGFLGVLLPTLLYGVAHNGGRTALFWCLTGLVAAQMTRSSQRSSEIEKVEGRQH